MTVGSQAAAVLHTDTKEAVVHEVYSICFSSLSVRPLRLFVNRTLLTNLLYPGALAFFFDILTPVEGKSVDDEERIWEAYVPKLIWNWYVFVE